MSPVFRYRYEPLAALKQTGENITPRWFQLLGVCSFISGSQALLSLPVCF